MSVKKVVVVLSIILCGAGMAAGQTVWEQYPGNPILGPGDPGQWDAGGRMVICVLFDGSVYHMYFLGADAQAQNVDIGHATSPDGLPPWTMDPWNPVLTHGAPGEWDDEGLQQAACLYDGFTFHMWYSAFHGGIERGGYAWSVNGTDWTKDHVNNPVLDVTPGSWDSGGVRPTAVVLVDQTYKVWYAGYQVSGQEDIGLAESTDGIHWTKWPEPVLRGDSTPDAWDEWVHNPSVILDRSIYHMWYPGHRQGEPLKVGYAYSGDGVHWSRHLKNPVMQIDNEHIFTSRVLLDGSVFRMWYMHSGSQGIWNSYATSECCAGIFGDGFETGDASPWTTTVP